ncbi:hypothetical protein HU200_002422 [Digitaria exilis]|uniref:Uncharacterized protein n=1 Tax=Digitaria exilis TaxID=1010633 RepID=A0A835KU08_9POAL|nr:hypothetical protein HU200_002422 [Digitaria exilis]
MYLSYHTLYTFKYRGLEGAEKEVTDGSLSLYFSSPLKRFQRSVPLDKDSAGSAVQCSFDNGDKLQSAVASLEAVVTNMTEFVMLLGDIRDEEWAKFYSSVSEMGEGSKVILITRLRNLSRFGTVKPIFLNSLAYEEYSYLFRVLSFGSTNMEDHPRLASMVQEFPLLLRGSLISAYAFADMLKKNLSPQFWASVLDRFRGVVESNLSLFGEHPKLLLDRDLPTDMARFISPSAAPLLLMPPRSEADTQGRPLPMLTFGELMEDPGILPRGDFDLVTWESTIAPYSKYVHYVPAAYAEEKPEMWPTRRKRRAVSL